MDDQRTNRTGGSVKPKSYEWLNLSAMLICGILFWFMTGSWLLILAPVLLWIFGRIVEHFAARNQSTEKKKT
jgi:hypothetical protein